jgi:hypothetical protein
VIVAPSIAGGDAYDHLLYVRDIAESDHRLPQRPTKFATGGIYAYPYLIHWVLSFVPERYYQTIERYFSAASDTLFLGVILAAKSLGFVTWQGTLVIAALFIAAPQFVRPDLSHGTGLSTRKPGLVLVTASLIAFVAWVEGGPAWILLLAALASAGVCLTSKFGLQALLFASLGLATVAPASLILVPSAIAVAAVVSRGRYLSVLEAHLRHSYNYATTQQFMISYTKPTLPFERIVSVLSGINSPRDLAEVGYRSHIIRPIVSNPTVVLAVATLALASDGGITVVSDPVRVWLLAGIGAYVLTSLPYLRFLGQAERYLEYVFLPAAIIVARGWMAFGTDYRGTVVATILAGFLVIAIFVWAYQSVFAREDVREKAELLEALRGKEPGVLLIQPRWGAAEIAWESHHKVIDMSLNAGSTPEAIEEINHLLVEDAGYITADVDFLASRYDPEWVVFDVEKMTGDKKVESDTPWLTPPNAEPEFAGDRFELYAFEDVRRSCPD